MNLRYKEGTSISDHLSEFQGYFDQLYCMGVKFEDEIWDFGCLIPFLIHGRTFVLR